MRPLAASLFALASLIFFSQPAHAAADGPVYEYLGFFGANGQGFGQFWNAFDLAVSPTGVVYVADRGNNRIDYFGPDGSSLGQWGDLGSGPGQFRSPTGIDVDQIGFVFVTDPGNGRVQKFTSTGAFVAEFGAAHFTDPPLAIAVNPDGVVSVGTRSTVLLFDNSGGFLSSFPVAYPYALTVLPDTSIVLNLYQGYDVGKYSPRGLLLAQALANGPCGPLYPSDIARDPEGRIVVANGGAQTLAFFDADLSCLGRWVAPRYPDGPIIPPTLNSVGFAANGDLYILDAVYTRIAHYRPLSVPARTATWGSLKALYR